MSGSGDNPIKTGSLTDQAASLVQAIRHPGGQQDLSHDPKQGVHVGDDVGTPSSFRDIAHSEDMTKIIHSKGNTSGKGMEGGLATKATAQAARWGERSQARQDGTFQPHTTHKEATSETNNLGGGTGNYGGSITSSTNLSQPGGSAPAVGASGQNIDAHQETMFEKLSASAADIGSKLGIEHDPPTESRATDGQFGGEH